jgi:hypothetical protein
VPTLVVQGPPSPVPHHEAEEEGGEGDMALAVVKPAARL